MHKRTIETQKKKLCSAMIFTWAQIQRFFSLNSNNNRRQLFRLLLFSISLLRLGVDYCCFLSAHDNVCEIFLFFFSKRFYFVRSSMNLSLIGWIKIEKWRLLIPFNLYTDVPIWKFSLILNDEKSPSLKKYGGLLLSLFELTRLMLNVKKLKNRINFNILSIKVKLFSNKTTKFLNSGNHYGYKVFFLLSEFLTDHFYRLEWTQRNWKKKWKRAKVML